MRRRVVWAVLFAALSVAGAVRAAEPDEAARDDDSAAAARARFEERNGRSPWAGPALRRKPKATNAPRQSPELNERAQQPPRRTAEPARLRRAPVERETAQSLREPQTAEAPRRQPREPQTDNPTRRAAIDRQPALRRAAYQETLPAEPMPDPAMSAPGTPGNYNSGNRLPGNHAPHSGPPMDGPWMDGYDDGPMMSDGPMMQDCWNPCRCLPPVYFRGEYLLWWTKNMDTPPLATSSPVGTAQTAAAVIGQPNTTTVFGDADDRKLQSGARLEAGMWFDQCRNNGLDVTYLILGDQTDSFHGDNGNFPVLGRPFLNVRSGAQDARLINFPNTLTGTVDISTSTQFDSIEVLYRHVAYRDECSRLDTFAGYRHVQLDDSVRIDESSLSLTGATTGATLSLRDQFDTTNSFHGAEIGALLQWSSSCRGSWELLGKLALGSTNSHTTISGQTTSSVIGGASSTAEGGLLTQGTNLGTFSRDQFTAVGELGLVARRQFCNGWTAVAGYRLLYVGEVYRAGDQIDSTINTTQIPPGTLSGPANPAFQNKNTDFWAQGLTFGLEFCY